MSPKQLSLQQNFELMCLNDDIAPVGGEIGDISQDEVLAALAMPDAFSELIVRQGGVRVELVPDDPLATANRVMAILDALNGHAQLFDVSIQHDAAYLVPASIVDH